MSGQQWHNHRRESHIAYQGLTFFIGGFGGAGWNRQMIIITLHLVELSYTELRVNKSCPKVMSCSELLCYFPAFTFLYILLYSDWVSLTAQISIMILIDQLSIQLNSTK